jgi:esterase/lipase
MSFKEKKNKEKDKRDIENAFYDVIKDIMDNFEKYTPEDQQAVQDKLTSLEAFNTEICGKYDLDQKVKKNLEKLRDAFNRFFGGGVS